MPPSRPYNNAAVMYLMASTVDAVFKGEGTWAKQALDSIMDQNTLLGGTQNAFSLGGKNYLRQSLKQFDFRGIPIKPLHKSLYTDMQRYYDRTYRVETDRTKVTQFFKVLFPRCQNLQDLRDALPEPVVSLVPELQRLPRSQEKAFVLRGLHPAHMGQFDRVTDIVLFYIANRLVY